MRADRLVCGLIIWLVLLSAPRSIHAAPEIFALVPETGPAGTPIQIKGKGLATAKRVYFAAHGTFRTARFSIISDRELKVLAPDFYSAGTAAIVAVLTDSAMSVAMPAAVETVRGRGHGHAAAGTEGAFLHVLNGGRVQQAQSIALIETGGAVGQSSSAAMNLVKRGGTLLEFSNPSGILFYEPGATLGPQIDAAYPSPKLRVQHHVRVLAIEASPGVGPFIYQNAPRPDPGKAPLIPPMIRSIGPLRTVPGGHVGISGKGFARTTEVLFIDSTGLPAPAGFRVVSDEQLDAEVPVRGGTSGVQFVAISTTEGLTVTTPRSRTLRPGPAMAGSARAALPRDAIVWLGPGDFATEIDNHVVFVAPGGRLPRVAAGSTVFVQHDAGVIADLGLPWDLGPAGNSAAQLQMSFWLLNSLRVYSEPGANVPESLRQTPIGREVRAIVPSFVEAPFVVEPPQPRQHRARSRNTLPAGLIPFRFVR
jgi:hypothetical protein